MKLPGFLRSESYESHCPRCHEELQIDRGEVERGKYQCPVCGQVNLISEAVRRKYAEKRAIEEQERRQLEQEEIKKRAEREEHTRKQAEEDKQLRAQRQLAKQQERERQEAETRRLRQGEVQRQVKENEGIASRLREGLCPRCGSSATEVMKKGYNSGTGLCCCLLGGPIGLAAGLSGSNEIMCVCKACGHQYKPGKKGL